MAKGKFSRFIIPKIFIFIAFLVVSVWMFWGAIDSIIQINAGNGWAGIGFALVIAIGAYGLGACILISLICLIIAIVKKNKGLASGGSVAYFALFMVLPVIVFIVIRLIAPGS